MTVNTLIKEKISEEIKNIRYSDLDCDKRVKPSLLLNIFQDIASDNAEKLGFGYSAIYPKNLMWVLLKYRIEFSEYPCGINDLILRTQPRGYNKLFAYRDFELSDGNKMIAKANSMWSLVDYKTMTLASIQNSVDSPFMEKYEKKENDLSFGKIEPITQIDLEKTFEVRFNDIDVNKHANNGNYIIWALEPLEYDFRVTHVLKTIDMVYKKEAKYGEKIISQVQINDNITIHVLKHAQTQEDLCKIQCEWIPVKKEI